MDVHRDVWNPVLPMWMDRVDGGEVNFGGQVIFCLLMYGF